MVCSCTLRTFQSVYKCIVRDRIREYKLLCHWSLMMIASSDIKLFASYPYSFSITATLYNQYVATYLPSRLAVVT